MKPRLKRRNTCKQCGTEFRPIYTEQRYCSRDCQGKAAAQKWQMLNGPEHLRPRLLTRIKVDEDTGCWIFTGYKNKSGYGGITSGHKRQQAYALYYVTFIGNVPTGEELHHRCETPSCVNPWHLEPTTHRRHIVDLTPRSASYRNHRKLQCPQGHPLAAGNLVPWEKYRKCLICHREHNRIASTKYRIQRDNLGGAVQP